MNDTPPERALTPEDLQRRTEALFGRIIRIGHMAFGEMVHPPRPASISAPTPPVDPNTAHEAPAPQATLLKNLPEHLDLEQARVRMPFTLRLPAWVPEGFVRVDSIAVVGGGFGSIVAEGAGQESEIRANFPFPVSAHVNWQHPDGRAIRLSITQLPDDRPEFVMGGITAVPSGAVRQVTIHGALAALLERQFVYLLPSGQTETSDDPELRWEDGRLLYALGMGHWPGAGDALIRIAESMAAIC